MIKELQEFIKEELKKNLSNKKLNQETIKNIYAYGSCVGDCAYTCDRCIFQTLNKDYKKFKTLKGATCLLCSSYEGTKHKKYLAEVKEILKEL